MRPSSLLSDATSRPSVRTSVAPLHTCPARFASSCRTPGGRSFYAGSGAALNCAKVGQIADSTIKHPMNLPAPIYLDLQPLADDVTWLFKPEARLRGLLLGISTLPRHWPPSLRQRLHRRSPTFGSRAVQQRAPCLPGVVERAWRGGFRSSHRCGLRLALPRQRVLHNRGAQRSISSSR